MFIATNIIDLVKLIYSCTLIDTLLLKSIHINRPKHKEMNAPFATTFSQTMIQICAHLQCSHSIDSVSVVDFVADAYAQPFQLHVLLALCPSNSSQINLFLCTSWNMQT